MSWLLDTNVISEPARPRPSAEVMAWVGAQPVEQLHTTTLAFAEIKAGIERLDDPERRTELSRWLAFQVRPLFGPRVIEADEGFWTVMLGILERSKAERRTLPMTDLVFAAAAERHGLVVVTRNVRHFIGSGVFVLNPWAESPEIMAT